MAQTPRVGASSSAVVDPRAVKIGFAHVLNRWRKGRDKQYTAARFLLETCIARPT